MVYVIGNRERGWYKIGYTDENTWRVRSRWPRNGHPSKTPRRVHGVQSSAPFKTERIAFILNASKSLETRLHQKFAAKRLHGEWFALTSDDLKLFEQQKSFCVRGETCPIILFPEVSK